MRLILCLTLALAACGGEGEGEPDVVWTCGCPDPGPKGGSRLESDCFPSDASEGEVAEALCPDVCGAACACEEAVGTCDALLR